MLVVVEIKLVKLERIRPKDLKVSLASGNLKAPVKLLSPRKVLFFSTRRIKLPSLRRSKNLCGKIPISSRILSLRRKSKSPQKPRRKILPLFRIPARRPTPRAPVRRRSPGLLARVVVAVSAPPPVLPTP